MQSNSSSGARPDRIERLDENLAEGEKSLAARQEVLRVKIESLHASLRETHASIIQRRVDSERDGEHLRALVRIAERRLPDFEGGQ
jgi:hypothetical protein